MVDRFAIKFATAILIVNTLSRWIVTRGLVNLASHTCPKIIMTALRVVLGGIVIYSDFFCLNHLAH